MAQSTSGFEVHKTAHLQRNGDNNRWIQKQWCVTHEHIQREDLNDVLFVKITYRQASEWWFADIFTEIVFLELNELQHQGCKCLVGWRISLKVLNEKQNKTVTTSTYNSEHQMTRTVQTQIGPMSTNESVRTFLWFFISHVLTPSNMFSVSGDSKNFTFGLPSFFGPKANIVASSGGRSDNKSGPVCRQTQKRAFGKTSGDYI